MATKFHKSGQRFVAGLSLCSTSNLSSMLSDVCNFVLETLRQQDDKRIKRTGIRRFFVVNGYEEVALFLHSWKFHSHANSLKTGDFSTMYTSLPLKKLKYNIRFALTEAWLYVAEDLGCDWSEIRLVWKPGSQCVWSRSRSSTKPIHKKSMHSFNGEDLDRLIGWLIDNTYVVNGSVCRRQTVGLPMGTNCAPALCNLGPITWEYCYIRKFTLPSSKVG